MAVLPPLPQLLLLLCLLSGQTLAGYQSVGSDISPEEAGVVNLKTVYDASVDQALTAVAELLQISVREVMTESHRELVSRLDGLQGALGVVPLLAGRLDDVERAIVGLREASVISAESACQVSVQKAMATISTAQEGIQTSLSDVVTRQDELQSIIEAVSSSQENVQESLEALESRQSNMTASLVALSGQLEAISGQQRSVQYLVDIVPTREEVQRSLSAQCRQDDGVSGALPSLLRTQQQVQKAVSIQNGRLEDLAESVAVLSERQRNVHAVVDDLPTRNYIRENIAELSTSLDFTQTLQILTKGQADTIQTLSSHSARLEGVTDSLAALSDGQQTIQRTLSAQSDSLDGTGVSLAAFSDQQRAAQRTLDEQSFLLAVVAEAVPRTPLPAGRPSLVTARLLGEPCRSDSECSSLRDDTVCGVDGRCQCAAGLQPVAGETCRPYPRLSEPCRATADCRGVTALAVCADDHCACPRGLFSFNNNTECVSGLGIGDPCARDADCPTLVGLTCRGGACELRTCASPRPASSQQYRLAGGDSCTDGLLQFSFNAGRLWQYVCDSDWTAADADVACRYLGFAGGAPLPWNNTAANEPNFLSVQDFVCDGSERSLSRCRRVYGRGSCAATELAKVRCSGPEE